MMKKLLTLLLWLPWLAVTSAADRGQHLGAWPDGTPMDAWFGRADKVDAGRLGRRYVLTDYGVSLDSTLVQTRQIQRVIDLAAAAGGGVIVVPEGTFQSGALFFQQGTHLHVIGTLKGSSRIADFPLVQTRIEGESCLYFAALVNVDSVDGFTLTGHGTIDGNGWRYWQDFWMRRRWNPQCTNKDTQRPRLVYISHCSHVTLQDVRLINSPFWTNHIYKSHHVRFLDCHIHAPVSHVWSPEPHRGAPSSDAIDLDVCSDVLVKGCYMNVNDDAVVLKGGKGTWADCDTTNGPCERILIEDCHYGTVHACLTLGSESLHDRNVILRRCQSDNANRILWLKMRPDTPQHYEHVLVEDITGHCQRVLYIHPWTQFYRPQQRADMPRSRCHHITLQRIRVEAQKVLDVKLSAAYDLLNFTFDGHPIDFLNPTK